jgi:hypothetical protein
MTIQDKWGLVSNFKKNDTEGQTGRPEYWVDQLKKPNEKVLKKCAFHFSSKGVVWLDGFAKLGGLATLHQLLQDYDKKFVSLLLLWRLTVLSRTEENNKMKELVVQSLYKVANAKKGSPILMAVPGLINTVSMMWNCPSLKVEVRVSILKTLTIVCAQSGGHRMIMEVMTAYKKEKKERARFHTLVNVFNDTDHPALLLAIITFINALIGCPKDLDTRVMIRRELLQLNLNDGLTKLRKWEGSDDSIAEQIDAQLEKYDAIALEDEKQLKTRFDHIGDTSNIVFSDTDWMFHKIVDILKKSEYGGLEDFQAILVDLLGMDPKATKGKKFPSGIASWVLCWRFLHQISLLGEKSFTQSTDGKKKLFSEI